jgi:hypothetical protein
MPLFIVKADLEFERVSNELVQRVKNFLKAFPRDESPVNRSVQAVQLMEMLDAVYHSSQLGRELAIDSHFA